MNTELKEDYSNQSSNMTQKRTDKSKGDFTAISNRVLLNKNLSSNAIRVILTIFLLHPGTKLKQELVINLTGLSKHDVGQAFKELEFYGYIEVERLGASHKFKTTYTIIETPQFTRVDKFISKSQEKRSGKKDVSNISQVKTVDPMISVRPCQSDKVGFNINTSTNTIKQDDKREENNYHIDPENNVENNLVEFADIADRNEVQKAFDILDDIELGITADDIRKIKLKAPTF